MVNKREVAILLIEDNPNDAELIMRGLKKNNFPDKTYAVTNGEEALEFVFATGTYADRNIDDVPKLIILDLKLPRLSGLEVLRRIRSHEKMKSVSVVILTASMAGTDIKEAFCLGADRYIVKPVDLIELGQTLGNLEYHSA